MLTPRRCALVVALLISFASRVPARGEPVAVRSPSGDVVIELDAAACRVTYRGKPVIDNSPLGVTFAAGGALRELQVVAVRRASRDETYSIIAGKSSTARDRCNEATVVLRERGQDGGRTIEIVLRAYDDGAA